MSKDLIFNEVFGEFAGTFITDLIIREIQFDEGSIQDHSRSDKFEELIID